MTTDHRPCHCLCGVAHPDQDGICLADQAVTSLRYDTRLLGPVDVPLCWPCAVTHNPARGDDQINLWSLVRPTLLAEINGAAGG